MEKMHTNVDAHNCYLTNLGAIININTTINAIFSSSSWWLLQGKNVVGLIETKEFKKKIFVNIVQACDD